PASEVTAESIRSLAPQVLILQPDRRQWPEAVLALWEEAEMDAHVPVLILQPSGEPPFVSPAFDEPLDEVFLPTDPREMVARVAGLIREGRIRIFRRSFHDLSQPLTVARAFARKALSLSVPASPNHATLQELDRQVERIFRIAEDLQRRRHE